MKYLLICLILSSFAHAQKPACAEGLAPLPKISASLIKRVKRILEERYGETEVAGWPREDEWDVKRVHGYWKDQHVFLKRLNTRLPNEAGILQLLNQSGIGVKALGTFRKKGEQWLALEFIEGQLYRPIMDWGDCTPEDNWGWDYHPNRAAMPKCHLSEKTFADVEHAYAILDQLKIAGNDIQFMITPEGRAILIDTGYYAFTNEAPEINAISRAVVIEGLEAAAILQFRPADDPYRPRQIGDERDRNSEFRRERGW